MVQLWFAVAGAGIIPQLERCKRKRRATFAGNSSSERCMGAVKPHIQCNHHQRIANLQGFPHKQRRVHIRSLVILAFLFRRRYMDYWHSLRIGPAGWGQDDFAEATQCASYMCHQFVSPRFRVLHSPACLLHLHSPPPCPHPTKMLKVVRRMRCGFEMQTSGPRDDVTGRHKAQAEDKYIAHQKAAALELKTRGWILQVTCRDVVSLRCWLSSLCT